jgi:hypothetical protein
MWCGDFYAKKIYAVELGSPPKKLKEFSCPGSGDVSGLAWDGVFLWALAFTGQTLYRLDPESGKVLGSIPLPVKTGKVYDVTYLHGAFWGVYYGGDQKVYKFDPKTGAVLHSFAAPETGIIGFAGALGDLWAVGYSSAKAFQVSTGETSWLGETPQSGNVAAKASQDVTVSLNGLRTPGKYTANVVIASNDPDLPLTLVPVTFTVLEHTPPTLLANQIVLVLSVTDPSGRAISLEVAGQPARKNADGTWSATVTLDVASKTFQAIVKDEQGQTIETRTIQVVR